MQNRKIFDVFRSGWESIGRIGQNYLLQNHQKSRLMIALLLHFFSGTGHLLKSPFCVHPKTGFVCVPIDPQRIDEFDPTKVPRLGELMEQLSQASASAEGEASEAAASAQHLLPYKQTTLRPYIEFFDNFVVGCVSSKLVD
ncbi:unnamed protein product [Mesocestoides corti]|uniref:Uncharacterized protein n=1 Tax=Mesocestoides corti TaxID=53468 RepID=A0A0R3U9P6_MESCO|nr:unnamed protein product [Mesocestoides corti]